MKKSSLILLLFILLALFALFVLSPSRVSAQNFLVSGNVGIKDVNITENTTFIGTSSDKNGNFQLKVFSEDATLRFTCVGYADTIISLNSNDFHNREASIIFKMRQISYDLPSAEISASKYFYRSKFGVSIVDISFIDDKTLILENKKSKSELKVIDNEGNSVSNIKFDSLYNEIFVDFFSNYILVGEHYCQQIRFDEDYSIEKVANFSRKDFEEKLRVGVRKFNDCFVFKDKPLIVNNIYARRDHNKSIGYFYINPNDSVVERHQIHRFIDEEGYKAAAALFAEIISLYHAFSDENEDLINLGLWDGNLMRILPEPECSFAVEAPCGWRTRCFVYINQYIKLDAKPLNISVFDKDNILYFVYLDEMKLLSFDDNFNLLSEKDIESGANAKYFTNTIIEDCATADIYGVFVKDGISFLASLDLETAKFEHLTKVSNFIYPNVLKINNNIAYCAYFNAEKQYSFIQRTTIK